MYQPSNLKWDKKKVLNEKLWIWNTNGVYTWSGLYGERIQYKNENYCEWISSCKKERKRKKKAKISCVNETRAIRIHKMVFHSSYMAHGWQWGRDSYYMYIYIVTKRHQKSWMNCVNNSTNNTKSRMNSTKSIGHPLKINILPLVYNVCLTFTVCSPTGVQWKNSQLFPFSFSLNEIYPGSVLCEIPFHRVR